MLNSPQFLSSAIELPSRRLALCGAPHAVASSAGHRAARGLRAQPSLASKAAPAAVGARLAAFAFGGFGLSVRSPRAFPGAAVSAFSGVVSGCAASFAVRAFRRLAVAASHSVSQSVTGCAANTSVNGTPNCCAVWFPRLRLGARYLQRYAIQHEHISTDSGSSCCRTRNRNSVSCRN